MRDVGDGIGKRLPLPLDDVPLFRQPQHHFIDLGAQKTHFSFLVILDIQGEISGRHLLKIVVQLLDLPVAQTLKAHGNGNEQQKAKQEGRHRLRGPQRDQAGDHSRHQGLGQKIIKEFPVAYHAFSPRSSL